MTPEKAPVSQAQDYPYATYLDVKFAPLSVVDVPGLIALLWRGGEGELKNRFHSNPP